MTARERLKEFCSEHLKGQCKILSKGPDCQCALCDMDRIVAELVWYAEQANALNRYARENKIPAVEAVLVALSLDAGARGEKVLGKFLPPEEKKP